MTNLASVIFRNPAIDPDRVAMTFGDHHLTHRAFRERVARVANALSRMDVRKGDRVCVLLGNCPQFLECFFAITVIGALYVPLNTLLSAREHALLLADCKPVVLISEQKFAATLASARSIDSLRLVVLVDGKGDTDYERILASSTNADPFMDAAEADDAAIVYTSGTTSLPKGAVLTHGSYLSDWENLRAAWKPTVESVNLQVAPLYHASIVHSLVHLGVGARTILMPEFDPSFVLRTIGTERVTHLFCVPTIIYDLMDHADFARSDFSSLRTIEYGAAPMTSARLEEALRIIGRPVFIHAYGMTETTSHCCVLGGEAHNAVLGSVGKPLPSCRMRIADENGNELPPDTIGEILIGGPNIMSRYWGRVPETEAALKDGWMHSGDLGRRNAEGFYFVVDRKKDMIISGGVNIYPKDVEEVMARCPTIAEVAVYGAPHPRWGEMVVAAIKLKPGAVFAPDQLQRIMEDNLGRHMLPKRVDIVSDFPRNGTGKIMKHVLRKQATERTSA